MRPGGPTHITFTYLNCALLQNRMAPSKQSAGDILWDELSSKMSLGVVLTQRTSFILLKFESGI